MKRSINETGDVIPEWKYKLLSLYEPKPLDLAFKLFLLDSANDQKSATEMYDYLRQSNKLIRPDLEYFAGWNTLAFESNNHTFISKHRLVEEFPQQYRSHGLCQSVEHLHPCAFFVA